MLPIRLAEGKQNDKLDVVRQLVLNITFPFSVSLAAGIPGCRWGKTGHHDSTYIFLKKTTFILHTDKNGCLSGYTVHFL